MYQILQSSHSGLRWLVLIALVVAIVQGFSGKASKRTALIAMILYHVQLLIGLGLYFGLSPKVEFSDGWIKNAMFRFYGMEHIFLMVIAGILITIGYKKIKAGKLNAFKWLFLLGLILVLLGIPWPFREELMAGWY